MTMNKKKPAKMPKAKARVQKALQALGPEALRFFPETDSMCEPADTPWVVRRGEGEDKTRRDRLALDHEPAHSGIL